jgi:hypothetical protein
MIILEGASIGMTLFFLLEFRLADGRDRSDPGSSGYHAQDSVLPAST